MQLNQNFLKEVIIKAIDKLNNIDDVYIGDLHNEIFNTDYLVIGHNNAKYILKRCNYDVFDAIDDVKTYEIENFSEFNTKINPENIVNMLAYIYGYEVLSLSKNYDELRNEGGKITNEQSLLIRQDLLEYLKENF